METELIKPISTEDYNIFLYYLSQKGIYLWEYEEEYRKKLMNREYLNWLKNNFY